GRDPRICHSSTRKPMITSGGSTWVPKPRTARCRNAMAGWMPRARAAGCRASPGMARGSFTMLSDMPAPSRRLQVLDLERVEVLLRIGRIEHLAVEELLHAARGGRRDVPGRHAQFLRGGAPQVLAVHPGDQRLRVQVGRQVAPAHVLGE